MNRSTTDDLTGEVFGDILVLNRNEEASQEYYKKHHHTRYFWNCKCLKCGDESIKQSHNILRIHGSGCTKCHGKGSVIGQIFGTLKVLSLNEEETERRSKLYGHSTKAYNCECTECHTQVVKIQSELTHFRTVGTSGCKECNRIDLTGQKIGRLLVLGLSEHQEWGKQIWICQCDCGTICEHQTGDLTKKNPVQSCGCLQREAASETGKRTIHLISNHAGIWNGDSKNPEFQRIYQIWGAMKRRCDNPNDIHYAQYGGRGIKVCVEWYDWFVFKEWALSHGYQDDLTIDRIDTNGNYEPDNCRWATQQEQCNNTRANKMLTYNGETNTLANWCRILNLNYFRTKARLNSCNYTVEEAFELGRYEYRTT